LEIKLTKPILLITDAMTQAINTVCWSRHVFVQLRAVMASNDARPLTLFCWILGVSDHPFPVDIEDIRTVGHLKEAIVKKKPIVFANVDPDQLTLWKVCGFSLSLDRVNYSTLLTGIHHNRRRSQE
jgi:hypothetical protein